MNNCGCAFSADLNFGWCRVGDSADLAMFVEVEIIGRRSLSLAADMVCKIGALWVSQSMDVFDKCKACRKPAPFGKRAGGVVVIGER